MVEPGRWILLACTGVVVEEPAMVDSRVPGVFFPRTEVGAGREECRLFATLLLTLDDLVFADFGTGV
jgi:hypothetical protein